jgi:hypothetical protein
MEHQTEGLGLRLSDQASRTEEFIDQPVSDNEESFADVDESVAEVDESSADDDENLADVDESFADAGGPAGEPRPATGEPRVDAALARLDELAGRPVSEHRAIFEDVHRRLRDVLGDLDTRQAHADDRSDAASRPGR